MTPGKKELLLELLERSSVFVSLDGRAEGVALPDWLRTEPQVVLQLGYQLAIPIPDLAVDDQGIRATLSFRRAPFAVRVPWPAVFALSDDEGHQAVFPEDVPPDLGELPPDAPPPKKPEPPARPRASHLKLVK